jgi:hydrogenase expression/formation protein HypE
MPETLSLRRSIAAIVCLPGPIGVRDRIVLGHGSGGRLSANLLRDVFLPLFSNPVLDRLDDQAVLEIGGAQLAFTTDSFVVKPLFFPGGDIGSLAVHGTVNDLAMGGATPLYLSAAFIIEEGFPLETWGAWPPPWRKRRHAAGRHHCYRRHEGGGKARQGRRSFHQYHGHRDCAGRVSVSRPARRGPATVVILSGSIGDHGTAIMASREGLEFETTIVSDSAPLHRLGGGYAGRLADVSSGASALLCAIPRAAGSPARSMRLPRQSG